MSEFHDRLIEIDYLVTGGGWDWADWHAYWDPVTRMYFVGFDAGCSCNDYDIEYSVDQSEGLHSKTDVIRRLNDWLGDDLSHEADAGEVRANILKFQPPKEGR